MRGFDIKQIRMRSFQISGLTAKWGIGGGRSPIWDNNLVGRWGTRTFPDGALATIPNTATMEGEAPDLTVTGATMASGTLQFDGVDDYATAAFVFPNRFTLFWEADWSGTANRGAGIIHLKNLHIHNDAPRDSLSCRIRPGGSYADIPNTSVGIPTAGKYYSKSGTAANFTGTIGESTVPYATGLLVGCNANNTLFTQMGFRQLLIFNKEPFTSRGQRRVTRHVPGLNSIKRQCHIGFNYLCGIKHL